MGLFRKTEKNSANGMILTCEYDHPDSFKCIFLATYRNLAFKVNWVDSSSFEDKTSQAFQLPNSDRYPIIYDGDLQFLEHLQY